MPRTSSIAVPRSMPRRLAETTATRTWSARWISLGPIVGTTSATLDRRTAPPAGAGTSRSPMEAMVARSSSRARTSTSILRSWKL